MKFSITALLAAVVLLPAALGYSPANWTWRALETKPGPLPTRREVATFIRSLEARNISLNLPSHMINLYRSYNSRNYTGLSTHERPVLPEADTVRSLVAKSFRHNGSRWIVTFDMSTLAASEQLQFAELRISLPAFAESCSLLEIRHHSQYPCGPTVCQDQLVLGSFPPDSALEDAAGCAVYNVTDILRRWMDRDRDRYRDRGERGHLPPTESLGCKRKRSLPDPVAKAKAKPENKEMALLLVFSRRAERSCSGTSSLLKDARGSRRVRRPPKRKGGRRKQSSKTGRGRGNDRGRGKGRGKGRGRGRGKGKGKGRAGRSGAPRLRHARHHGKAGISTPCRRIKFEIKFGKIGWGAWVIFPKVYNAFRCEGECPIPTGEDVKPTNHAYMQSLLKFHHPSLVPSPCCVPIKMSPMSMLYIEKGEVVLRHHENMVVRECGCR